MSDINNTMPKPIKWILWVIGTLLFLVIVLIIIARVYVGAVNVALSGDFDPVAMEKRIKVPDGFSIGLYAKDIQNARVLRFTAKGDLLVAMPNRDKVELLKRDADQDGKPDGRRTLIDGLNGPNGLDFFEDWLYIAETDAIGRVGFDHQTGQLVGDYERLVTGLPAGGNHWKKTLRFGEDGLMYVAMGSSCNVCVEEDKRRAAMVRYTPDGKNETIFALGLRNSAGFDWSPRDGQIYATDNGRDMLGDDFPPCELNKVEEGGHYGWPYANGDRISDPDFGEGNESLVESSAAPVFGFKAHNAPLGIEFVRGDKFPKDYHGAAIVALHGSWNRSDKDGYKVVSLHWDEKGQITERDFVSGFLVNDDVIGRPAEVAEGPDGAIYIADDFAGVVYRVAYGVEQTLEAIQAAWKFNAGETLAFLSAEEKAQISAEGLALFNQSQCIDCHREPGEAFKELVNLGEKYNLESLMAYLKKPNSPMPQFPFSDEQRRPLAVYLIETYPGGNTD